MDALVQTVTSVVTNLLKETTDDILNAKDDLKKLQRMLKNFQKAIKDADRKPLFSKERNRDQEVEFKDVLYDAQDIMEEYRSKIEASKRDQVRKPSWTTAFTSFHKDASFCHQLGNKIKKINERLDEIKTDWDMVYRINTTPKGGGEDPAQGTHDNPRETTHHMGVQPPTCREDDKNEIVKRLLSNDSAEGSKIKKGGVSIISIVGKGGIGKTTLAKMIFEETKEHFGQRRWWVCISEKPNRKDLVRQILREVSGKNLDCPLSELCTHLQKELSKEKFLLVLDDVWEMKWWEEEVEGTLMTGVMGSNILITTRNKNVSDGMCASYMHELREFSFEQSWELFLKEALREGLTEEDLIMHNIKDVGVRIVEKCGGLPLVIKTVGSMLRTKKMSSDAWKFVKDSEIWKWKMPAASSSSTEIGGYILPGLMLSYDDLPYYLKSCFVYCCIYPKDYEIERERLIMQWVANGLIEEGIDVEATANQYIEDLIRRCLIEETQGRTCLKLHDILHDLASYIGGEEYSDASTSQRTRHLSLFAVDNAEEALCNATATTLKLRTLLTKSLPFVHLTNFKWLRVLSLMELKMDELPNSIEDLALLKYLDLNGSNVRWLPSSIGRLCNLQTLDLSDSRIEELPKELGELCNLRYLGLENTWSLKFVAEGLGKLTNLRTMHRFLVCDDKDDTKGCDIRELKDLNKLKGELSIEGLGRSRKAIDDVENAQLLKDKHGIVSLELDFGTTEGDDEQSGVLEALEPPHVLELLEIYNYKGQMPTWHLKTEYTMLGALKLVKCPLWEKAISITSLKVLNVIKCAALREIPSMPALELLKVHECNMLKTVSNMPALKSLTVSWCDGLEQLPHHMPALKSLAMENLGNWEGWPAGGSGETTVTSMSCLRWASFCNCPKMQTQGFIDALSELAGHDGQATQLQSLSVWKCPSARLGWKLLEKLPNLIYLWLDSESAVPSPVPSEISTFLPSLKSLGLSDKSNVDEVKWGWVPQWVWGLSQLERLNLNSFSEDICLGGHWQCLPKLKYLSLHDFHNLKSLVEVNNITLQQQQNETTCPTDAQQQQIACLSNLQSLTISSCPALHLPQELSDRLRERLCIES